MSDRSEIIAELREYFDQRADAEYYTDRDGPVPNEEMQMLAKLDQLQSAAHGGHGAEAVAWECSGEPGLYDNITRSKGEADHHRKIGRTVRPLVYGDTQPQPAVPEGWCKEIEAILDDYEKYQWKTTGGVCNGCGNWNPPGHPEAHGHGEDCPELEEYERRRDWKRRLKALLSTPTTPRDDGWIQREDRLPTEADADVDNNVWVYDKAMRNEKYRQARVPWWTVKDVADYTHWLPTGLKRPQPPAGQEGA